MAMEIIYVSDRKDIEAVEMMADIMILREAADVIKKWQNEKRPHSAAVAIIECDLMASNLTDKLYQDYGVIA